MTDRLVHIISSIQRGRGNGVLTARRGEGILLEEGSILFVNGQVSRASSGRRRGSEALNWLSTWENCRYLFVPSEAAVHINQPSQNEQAISARLLLALPPATAPAPQTARPAPFVAEQVTSPVPGLGEGGAGGSPPASVAPYPTQQLAAALHLIEGHGLSRAHRQLFYLVDGRRSITDLVRLMRKRGSEIYALLGDLERARVIRIK